MTDATTTKPSVKRVRKMAREPQAEAQAPQGDETASAQPTETPLVPLSAEKPKTKTTLILEMLRRSHGTTLEELAAATGWLPHTTRAVLTGLRKKGHAIDKQKVDGVTRYVIAGVATQ